jgi:hypothetical protein
MSLSASQFKLHRVKAERPAAEAELQCEKEIAEEQERAGRARVQLALRNETAGRIVGDTD